ncbi:hypothetical protein HDU76_011225, partial [Blyttiomyces sp. JEL0837]
MVSRVYMEPTTETTKATIDNTLAQIHMIFLFLPVVSSALYYRLRCKHDVDMFDHCQGKGFKHHPNKQKYVKGDSSKCVHHDEALKSDMEKSEFLAFFAHEIRNPLHAILGLVDISLTDYKEFVSSNTNMETKQKLHLSIKDNLAGIQSFGQVISTITND